ncbi:MAG: 50S ribosomal protein L6 [Euryarchaeota archaeon RBG_19FT_COMBO_56_21]|nr:archaeal ribosomal protein L6P [uncultured archaeon]OGS56973.1 MAG: 50S ribosomal protein L6 [Euryarchaeota archaeon RBG_19FT_COMBO_56_21]
MRGGPIKDEIEIPEKVNVTFQGGIVKVKGPQGEISKDLHHPRVKLEVKGKQVVVSCEFPRKREKALAGTYGAHIRNMLRGATDGFEYKMKIVYAHFPIKTSIKGNVFVIENFLGEKFPRKTKILGSTKVEVKGDQVLLKGPNVEDVGQTAANIERATKIRGFDPRVFQDGIYIIEKPGR